MDESIFGGVTIILIASFSSMSVGLELRDGEPENGIILYYIIGSLLVSVWCLIEVIVQFSMRGFKEVWKERPIMYFEALISTLYWSTAIYDVLITAHKTNESKF